MTTPRPTVVCNRELPDAVERERLERLFEVVVVAEEDGFASALAGADGAVVILPTLLTADLVAAAPRLRVVATVSSGVDHVDLEALERRGVALVSGGGVAPSAVAEWVLWALIGLRRGLAPIAGRFAAGEVDWGARLDARSSELSGTSVGLVGYGNVGRAVAALLEPFGTRVLVFDPAVEPAPGREPVPTLAELCERSDAVSVHVPSTRSTRGLIGRRELELIGPEGLLLNAARGEIVDRGALLAALRDGSLGWAAVDCFDPEPADPAYVAALAATGRVLLTPHVAGASRQALAALCRTAVDGIAAALSAGSGR